MSSDARYIVGIDLGTTNSALAAIDLGREGDLVESLAVMPVPQLVAPAEVAERRLLPSAAYLPGEHELPPGSRALPWGEPDVVVGEWAKVQGARVPGRLVASAKSWLSHPRVDRTAPILPWGAPEGVPRVSPVEASALFLSHLREAWARAHPGAPLAAQEVVLTVPASFDEAARELTVRAARQAGLGRLTLVEEPQAAFHDWAAQHRDGLGAALAGAALILVADVGGGTTDFTLIHAAVRDGAPALTRIAVGDHLLLGGDNVDITLARRVEERLGARLDAVQWSSLVQVCRAAKEQLLGEAAPASTRVSIPGRGSRLVGGTLSAEITREEVRAVLLDGFFPRIGPGDLPRRTGRAGLLELGLPYESEPAITRHALAFLRDHAAEVAEATGRPAGDLPRPDAILLNGGVFTPREVRERLREVVSGWFPGSGAVALLESARLDVAVARGAAYSGLVRRGVGLRIGGGTPRGYYVAIESPGEQARALCVIPRHLEEGREIAVPRTFALLLDRPVRFAPYATRRARFDQPGDVVALDEASFQALPPIETVLRGGGGGKSEVPVRLHAALTEIGTLDLWCVAEDRDARWKLEFQLRGAASDAGPTQVEAMPRRFADARALVELYYGKKAAAVDPRSVKGLVRDLEKVLGPRASWSTPVIRELWASLHAGMPRRRRSADHERLWCSLTGWCLRPGFGAPLDGWRASETFRAFGEGLQFQAEPHNWQAWWVLWRRIAGGLDDAAQARVLDAVMPFVPPLDPRRPKPRVAGVRPEATDELIRLAASLERVPAARKRELGEAVFARVDREGAAPHLLWALGRIGARVPFHGSAHTSIAKEVAEDWIARLLALPSPRAELAFALAQIARASGDRARDVEPETREAVLAALAQGKAPDDMVRPVREAIALGAAEEQRIFGDSLPAGLRLIS